MDAAMSFPTRQLDLLFEGPGTRQNRWTVGFRAILAIPQAIVLFFVSIAAGVVLIVGWFGALFMGRLPRGIHSFVAGVVRWYTRYDAYVLLLTDDYPPFTLEDEAYPVRPVVPDPGPLNRASVFFRIILAVPGWFFLTIVRYGLVFPLLFVAWLITLVKGSMPSYFYPAYLALVRYEARFYAWFGMLTSEYPWGMLGDPPAWSGAASGPAPAEPAPQPFAYPTPGQAPPPPAPAPGTTAPSYPPPMPPPMPPPGGWERAAASGDQAGRGKLILQGAARGWMIFAIVWGSVVLVGESAVQRAFTNSNNNNNNNNTGIFGNTGNTGNNGNTGGSGNTGTTP